MVEVNHNIDRITILNNVRQHNPILSFGLGNRTMNQILDILIKHSINHVVDVRNEKKQERNTRFSPNKLKLKFEEKSIDYHNLSNLLGDRSDYKSYMLSNDFISGIQSILSLTIKGNVAIICSEIDFRKCHRKLIANRLSREGYRVRHLGNNYCGDLLSQMTIEEANKESSPTKRRLFTVGFTRKNMREFAELLTACKINRVVDIRLRPISQYSGFAKQEDLEFLLELLNIDYLHLPILAPDNYLLDKYHKDYDWQFYEKRFKELLKERNIDELLIKVCNSSGNICFLCAEDLPEKCHRRLVAEHAKSLLSDCEIVHLTSQGIYGKSSSKLQGY